MLENAAFNSVDLTKLNLFDYMVGFVEIIGVDRKTGERKILLTKKNTIMYEGATIVAGLLGGKQNYNISHFYIGYSNNVNVPSVSYAIDAANTEFITDSDLGYLRVPLTYPASYTKTDNTYSNNIVIFSVLLNSPESYEVAGSASLTDSTSAFFEIALIAATNPSNATGDKMLARITFDRLTYVQDYNLTINWGVSIVSPSSL